jgi:hypothetical protein
VGKLIVTVLVPLLLAGCGPRRPSVYLGERPTMAARDKADREVEACLAVGEQYRSGTGQAGDVARGTAVGGAAGGAAGAAGGAIGGNAGVGAATGAATGAVWGLMSGLLRRPPPDPGYRGAVDKCLADRGLRVIAWE